MLRLGVTIGCVALFFAVSCGQVSSDDSGAPKDLDASVEADTFVSDAAPELDAAPAVGLEADAAPDAAPDAAVDAPPPVCGSVVDGAACSEMYATCTADTGCCICGAFGFGCAQVWHCSLPEQDNPADCPAELPSDGAQCPAASAGSICRYCTASGYPTTASCSLGKYFAWCDSDYCWIQNPTFSCGS